MQWAPSQFHGMHAKDERPSSRIGEAAASPVIGKMQYSIHSDRLLMEEIEYSILFR
jgi:hypothetical protein